MVMNLHVTKRDGVLGVAEQLFISQVWTLNLVLLMVGEFE